MPERRPLASRAKRVIDVNALAIFLVEDHPGNQYMTSTIEEGLRGAYIPVVNYHPTSRVAS